MESARSQNARNARTDAAARSTLRLRVRFGETDLMRIAHHSSYVVYMEAARVEWLRRRGATYAALVGRGMHLPVVELQVVYRAPARFDEELDVETSLGEVGAATLRFDYRIVRVEGGVLCAEGSTRLACVDEQGALRRLTADLLEILDRPETVSRVQDSGGI